MTSKWNYLSPTFEQETIESALTEQFPNCPAVSHLLVQRGITTKESVDKFLYPSMNDLHDPFLMKDMDKAVNRLNIALGEKEKILVFGDYDVDGTTAVALVHKFLSYYGTLDYYIPTRYEDGYGISHKCIDYAESVGVKLIIVLDCGIKAVEEVEYARSKGIDVIICDHHVPDDVLPNAVAILNPKLEDNPYPFKHLSGCGVGYKFMCAFMQSNGLTNRHELDALLDLVAVSIAADIVPMTDENRIMTYYGLKRLNTNPNVGLKSIIKICGLANKEITISDVIFKIGPRINASGRMQSGMEAVELLVTKSFQEAYEKGKNIDQYNRDRKELDKRITEEASNILADRGEIVSSKKPIVIYNKDWHKGIIGIVASRLTELYCKPCVVLTLANGLATGSSRSVQGFDIYKAIDSTRDLLDNFGGHTYAVGLSLKEENIPEFTRRFEEYVIENINKEQLTPEIDIDYEINFSEITSELLGYLKLFNPYGPWNQKPVFLTKNVYDYSTSKLVGKNQEHIKLELVDSKSDKVINGIAFNMSEHFDDIKSGRPFDICYTIEENKHKTNGAIQLQIKDIRFSED